MTAVFTANRYDGKFYVVLYEQTLNVCPQGSGGVVIVKTKQAILIGVYDAPVQAGEATKVVEGLADYLISVNYVRVLLLPLVRSQNALKLTLLYHSSLI